ncbi:nidogen-like domain-containing protein [Roseivivax marinus]|uniref:nidogen-like domain-containing protein n=1 Tax=Roseivivax marinus TaxID=1379903 RepID=UPI00273D145E|nr:nidogen-like domain-containing protein [Roseivivax marinus]
MANLIPGFGEEFLDRNDDGSTEQIDATPIFEDGINFFGTLYEGFWINNNGSITFANPRSSFTPDVITGVSNNPEITPYFADVDTRNEAVPGPTPGGNSTGTNLVYYDFDEANDRIIITWDDVGYFSRNNDLLNAFQLILTDRGDGDFDIQFRYEDVQWTTGNASGGSGGFGGTPARAGYTAGTGEDGTFFELPQSGVEAELIELENTEGNTGTEGIWNFFVRNGGVVDRIVPLLPEGARGGAATGDPHLVTLDGAGYDFQAAGEFVLVRDTASNLEIQARMVPIADTVSVIAAVATTVGSDVVQIDATDAQPVSVNGTPIEVENFGQYDVDGGSIFRQDDQYVVVYAGADGNVGDGDNQLIVDVRGNRIDVDVAIDGSTGSFEGLLGDGDGNPANDIARADGTVLARPLAFEDLYGGFRDDWRVTTDAQSLFTYDAGESLEDFYIADQPTSLITFADIDPDVLAAAQAAALAAGLDQGSTAFRNAVLDFALTNDESYLDSAANTAGDAEDYISYTGETGLVITGDDTSEVLVGTVLSDTISGAGGNDTITGGGDVDVITGDNGADSIDGGGGDDRLEGNAGADTLFGGAGDDGLIGGGGNDVLDGGAGDDNIAAGTGNDVLDGDVGDDRLGGGEGNDSISGGDGNDTIGGGVGSDTVDAGAGDDVVAGGADADNLDGGAGDDTMGGSFADDTVTGGGGDDSLGGGFGQDFINAGPGNNAVGGGEGNDTIIAGGGTDFLAGGGRNDVINGGGGDDTINGGDGNDTVDGGNGADVFVWNEGEAGAVDVIEGFEDGSDMLMLTGVENAPGSGLQGRVDALDITTVAGGGAAQLSYDGQIIVVEGVTAADLTVDDFMFI